MSLIDWINSWMGSNITLDDAVVKAEKALAENRMKDAFRSSRQALKINPGYIPAVRVHVKAGMSLRKYKDLEKYCDMLIADDSSDPVNWYYKGYVIVKRREPNLSVPKEGFQAFVKAHPLHFTPEYKDDLRKGSEFLYKAEKLEDESHKLPEYQKQSKLYWKLSREQVDQCIELTCNAWNILYDERAQAEEQKKLRELARQQDILLTAQWKDPGIE